MQTFCVKKQKHDKKVYDFNFSWLIMMQELSRCLSVISTDLVFHWSVEMEVTRKQNRNLTVVCLY